MNEKKDCNIVQDLLPNYIENLTSSESNKYIEEHLKNCSECKSILDNMKKEFNVDINKQDKREVKYIKKFSNKLKFLKIILTVILISFIGIYGYKFWIIKSMQGKIAEYKNITNFHIIKTSYYFNTISVQESFVKDDDYLVHVKVMNSEPTKEIISLKNGNTYMKVGENTKVFFNSMPIQASEKVYNNLETNSLWELLVNVFTCNIISVKCNDKDCYKIDNFRNSELLFPEQGYCVYIEKETGQIVRSEEGTRDNETGGIYTQVSDYRYEFNTVTDEDLKEPDVSEYEVVQ